MRTLLYEQAEEPQDDEDGFLYEFHSRSHFLWPVETHQILNWCRDQFGPSGFDQRWVSAADGSSVWVRHDRDAFEFKLRWVG